MVMIKNPVQSINLLEALPELNLQQLHDLFKNEAQVSFGYFGLGLRTFSWKHTEGALSLKQIQERVYQVYYEAVRNIAEDLSSVPSKGRDLYFYQNQTDLAKKLCNRIKQLDQQALKAQQHLNYAALHFQARQNQTENVDNALALPALKRRIAYCEQHIADYKNHLQELLKRQKNSTKNPKPQHQVPRYKFFFTGAQNNNTYQQENDDDGETFNPFQNTWSQFGHPFSFKQPNHGHFDQEKFYQNFFSNFVPRQHQSHQNFNQGRPPVQIDPQAITNAYKELGLNRSDDWTTIQKRFRKIALQYHPDKNKNPDALKKYQDINNAWEIIRKDKGKA